MSVSSAVQRVRTSEAGGRIDEGGGSGKTVTAGRSAPSLVAAKSGRLGRDGSQGSGRAGGGGHGNARDRDRAGAGHRGRARGHHVPRAERRRARDVRRGGGARPQSLGRRARSAGSDRPPRRGRGGGGPLRAARRPRQQRGL